MPRPRDAFLALHRFGLGARPGELVNPAIRADPRGWLKAQLHTPPPLPALLAEQPSTESVLLAFRESRLRGAQSEFRQEARQAYLAEAGCRVVAAAASPAPFYERLVRFWGDVLTVSIQQPRCLALVGPFEREVLRAGALGRYGDLLVASTQHPAMLLYLDNARSTGTDSTAGLRRESGRNENLAREILELHTLGVGAYSADDVGGLSDLLTGWGVDSGGGRVQPGARGFAFTPHRHQPGDKRLLGRSYPEGLDGGVRALQMLAESPETARHLSIRMARHFVRDDPPEEVVSALAAAWRDSGGSLRAVATALVDCEAAWALPLQKVRRPAELVIATLRALDEDPEQLDEDARKKLVVALRGLNQPPWSAPSPEGWPDTAAAWIDGDALLRRLELAEKSARRSRRRARPEPAALAAELLGSPLPPALQGALQDAPDVDTGLALLFASPSFQRR
jgi:uncharacterized protein (DUF1800 family)